MTIEGKVQPFVLKACTAVQFAWDLSLAMVLYTALADLQLKREFYHWVTKSRN
jgi:hypothetical protein